VSSEQPDAPAAEVVTQRRIIVTALPLKRAARDRLAELLGARIVDIREAVDHADLVLTPSCSPQLIERLKREYSGARIIVVELDDWDFDVSLPGPVKRLVQSGADAYLLADSIEELASKIGTSPNRREGGNPSPDARELQTPSTVDEIIVALLRESVEYSTRLRAGDDRPS
jgi:hypothetical protein